MSRPLTTNAGFSLVELAVVLVIVALLTGGLLLGVTAQRNAAEVVDARARLDVIREALLGYAMANGRLPCPAPGNLATGNPAAGVAPPPPCTGLLQYGVIPWVTLGILETDPWGNRFTYFVSSKFSGPFLAGSQASFSLNTGSPDAVPPDNAGTANVKEIYSSGANIASDLPAVVLSHGSRSAGAWRPDGTRQPFSADLNELENSDDDLTFVSRTSSDAFDDLLIWVPATILKAKMVAVGRLP